MSEQLIDDFDSLRKEEPKSHLVKILVFGLILVLLFLNVVGGKVLHLWIVQFYEFRNKFYSLISVNLVVSTLSVSVIPLIAYRIWIKKPDFKTWKSYLLVFVLAVVLFVGFFISGLELILQTAVSVQNENPLLPSYILIPRLTISFDLLFILSAIMSFLTLKWIFRKKRKKSAD